MIPHKVTVYHGRPSLKQEPNQKVDLNQTDPLIHPHDLEEDNSQNNRI